MNGHQIRLDGDGVTVTDGVNGHSIVMAGGGITVTDGVNSANKVTLGSSGIQLGGGTGQAMVSART